MSDLSTGLQYMNARFYNPATGRFLTQDTYSGNPYDPWTQHLYSYCGNNPVNMVDPTGHIAEYLTYVKASLDSYKQANIYTKKAKKAWDELQTINKNGSWLYGGDQAKSTLLTQKRHEYNEYLQTALQYTKQAVRFANLAKERRETAEENLKEDIDNFDFSNADENTVLESHYFSIYKNQLYIRHSIPNTTSCAAYGVVFLNRDNSNNITVMHEYGHTQQFNDYGVIGYTAFVIVPSLIGYSKSANGTLVGDYYNQPWEYWADYYGGVATNYPNVRNYDSETHIKGVLYDALAKNVSRRFG